MTAVDRIRHRACRVVAILLVAALAGCAAEKKPAKPPSAPPAPTAGIYKVGKPYRIGSSWYYPAVDYDYAETGIASWYGEAFHGKATANGETYDMNQLTAAHRTLPMPSVVRVTNLDTGRQLALRVNDRGPFVNNRIIDVSRRAAQLLGFERAGTAKVRVQILADESRMLALQYGAKVDTQVASAPVEDIAAAPTAAVSAEALAPPPGAKSAGAATLAPKPKAKVAAAPAVPTSSAVDGRVTVVATKPTSIFVQAGAFVNAANANRLRARLAAFGRSNVVPARVGAQRFYRVRLGPVATVGDADLLLARVIAAGHPQAQIVID